MCLLLPFSDATNPQNLLGIGTVLLFSCGQDMRYTDDITAWYIYVFLFGYSIGLLQFYSKGELI